MHYGLNEDQIKEVIQKEIDKNPDLKYYIDNPYFDELISLLIEGISAAIVKNTDETIRNYERNLKINKRMHGL